MGMDQGTTSSVVILMVSCGLIGLKTSSSADYFPGDGDDEFLIALFGPVDRDENNEPIKVCNDIAVSF